jgi:hypothetical protein
MVIVILTLDFYMTNVILNARISGITGMVPNSTRPYGIGPNMMARLFAGRLHY